MNAPEPITGRRRRKDARPQELLDAALSLFAEKGFAATRAEEVAARAGVAKGTLYLYFPSKQDLLKAVIEAHLGNRIADSAAIAEQYDGSIETLVREVLVEWWAALYDSPVSAVFKLVVTEVRNFPEIASFYNENVIEAGHQLVARIVQRGIERGEFRPVPVDSAVHSLLLPLVMLCLHHHSLGACPSGGGDIDGRRFIADHVELVLAGLRAAPAAAPRKGRRA